jgi:hypothetical protein
MLDCMSKFFNRVVFIRKRENVGHSYCRDVPREDGRLTRGGSKIETEVEVLCEKWSGDYFSPTWRSFGLQGGAPSFDLVFYSSWY